MKYVSGSLDDWRKYFRTTDSDIFDIIQHAILVAASDCPKEFKLRRSQIAEVLFSCKMTRCSGCNQVELVVPEDDVDEGCKSGFNSKVNSSVDNVEMNVNQLSNYSFGEAEALSDEIEEESKIVEEVLRIKAIIDNSKDESNSVLFESLRRLQLMALSVEILQATEIGKVVKCLRKHSSKEIQHLARTLIEDWMAQVDEWFNASTKIAVAEATPTPESINPSVLDEEEGLPSPPLDDIAFLSTPMDFSQFFDGMDDDGNPQNGGELNKNRDNDRQPSMENTIVPKLRRPLRIESTCSPEDNKGDQQKKSVKKQGTILKAKRASIVDSRIGRPIKSSVEQIPLAPQRDKSSRLGEADEKVKLEATKRKLQALYQKAENEKKQRTVQVMEIQDLPNQGPCSKIRHLKPGHKQNHPFSNRRR